MILSFSIFGHANFQNSMNENERARCCKQWQMNGNSFFNSDDGDSEFEGFSPSDIDETETRSIGSDISISEVDTDSSDDENPDQIDQKWPRNLKKLQVADFRAQIGEDFLNFSHGNHVF